MVIYYYFRFVTTILKMREYGCLHYAYTYSSAANNIQSYNICQRYVCVSYIHVCSGKICFFSDLQKFTL